MNKTDFALAIQEEWRNFQNGLAVDTSIIRPVIYNSWQRCRSLGIDPHMLQKKFVSGQELENKINSNQTLLNATRDVLNGMFSNGTLPGIMMALHDSDGVLLYYRYNSSSSISVPNVNDGIINTETTSGTNAVSVCLEEKKIVETCGAEHYCSSLHSCCCTAVPIWRNNQFKGALTLTVLENSLHALGSSLVKMASLAITQRMELADIQLDVETLLGLLEEGVIYLDNLGYIKNINPSALQILGKKDILMPGHISELTSSPEILNKLMGGSLQAGEIALGRSSSVASMAHGAYGAGKILVLKNSGRKKKPDPTFSAVPHHTFDQILGASSALSKAIHEARMAARSDVTTLILGESGTGKELFAQAIHSASSRANGPFIAVNCGALPSELVQSELFGYEEGSFTGASRNGRPGKFELAHNGSIFLDEIGEMPMPAQVSLLRFLQSGEVARIGDKAPHFFNVRVIAATNKNLKDSIRNKSFRADLYYRLNVFALSLPPLRARREDIEVLAKHFLKVFSSQARLGSLELSPAVLKALKAYSWPGNIRELENAISRMACLAVGTVIDADLLPPEISVAGPASQPTQDLLKDNEKACILRAIDACGGNLKAAAKSLGISRSGIYARMKRLGLFPSRARQLLNQ